MGAEPAPEAFERALGALARKERTCGELAEWLAARGFDPDEVEDAVSRLVEAGALDDERFARRYAEDKRELAGWGAERIRAALLVRGLDAGLVERALGAGETGEGAEGELERAAELLARRGEPLDDERSRGRALAFLARRGYELELAYEAVRRAERDAA